MVEKEFNKIYSTTTHLQSFALETGFIFNLVLFLLTPEYVWIKVSTKLSAMSPTYKGLEISRSNALT